MRLRQSWQFPAVFYVHGDDYVGLGVRGDSEGHKAKLSQGSKTWVPTVCMSFEQSHHMSSRVSRDVDVRRHMDFEQGQDNSLGQSNFPGTLPLAGPFLDEATSQVLQQALDRPDILFTAR